ncbi:MAG: glycosyltransferase family 1 protein [Thermoplasmata archaeon]|nr:MAG: glycosyltransferase family 1 protein [Thermoplasmata archaeon]
MVMRFRNIGFISTRIAGTDGVSLEIGKWADILERNGFSCYYFAGELDRRQSRSFLVEKAHFKHPDIESLTKKCFGTTIRKRETTNEIQKLKEYLKEKIYEFVEIFDIDLIIPENVLSIPLNIPLGLALTEFIAETGMPTIVHHHDFYWERDKFLVNAVNDYLTLAFPPDLPSIKHVVINSLASKELSHRKGISNTIIPNVYDFANPPDDNVDCSKIFKKIGLKDNDLFILQPTRILPRKQIERAIEIVHYLRLKNPTLVISHGVGYQEDEYKKKIERYAKKLGVKLAFISKLVKVDASQTGDKFFTMADIYKCADLVTYPSSYEGFGNAFLEAIYYKKPIVVNRYSIYITDIEPKGFDLVTINNMITEETIKKIKEVLKNKRRRTQIVNKNYELAKKYFSYEVLEELLIPLIRKLEKGW